VQATGTAPLAYQWFKNGDAIFGATGSSYSIAAASSSDEGFYSATVTNAFGSATSQEVTLTVSPQASVIRG